MSIVEKWEYKTLKFQTGGFFGGKLNAEGFDGILNKMGNEGWELVSCFDTSQTQGVSRDVITVFKRKKQ